MADGYRHSFKDQLAPVEHAEPAMGRTLMDSVATMRDPVPQVAPIDSMLMMLSSAHDDMEKQLAMLEETLGPVMADPGVESPNSQATGPQRFPDSVVGRRILDEVQRANRLAGVLADLRGRLEV